MRYRTDSYAADTYDSYFFDKNLQGDIVAIYNASGTKIGSYTYDAWGVCTVTINTSVLLEFNIVVTYNPLRYRGYYYDIDTQWYYLQSRYYTPKWCRFLNEDVYISTGQGILGYNMFAYCRNDPVSRKDNLGTDDVRVTCGEDDNVFNDMYISPGGGGAGGGSPVNVGGVANSTKIVSNNTVLYRWHSSSTKPNLTPRNPQDTSGSLSKQGVSFSTQYMKGSSYTTVERINSTGILRVTVDPTNPTHFLVRPIGASVMQWHLAGHDSRWTRALISAVHFIN